MSDVRVIAIHNDVHPYAWGMPGGVSHVLGWPHTTAPEAELWLGAHPSAPSRVGHQPTPESAAQSDAADSPGHPTDAFGLHPTDNTASPARFTHRETLVDWQAATGQQLPFLLKILTAAMPLSLQAHPNDEQAQAGFAREEAAGIARGAFDRNYKDPHAKPELIVALADGFQALCGFRPRQQTAQVLTALANTSPAPEPIIAYRDLLTTPTQPAEGLRAAVSFALSRTSDVRELVDALLSADLAIAPVIAIANAAFAKDDGIALALLLNHITLQAGESLWLPAGNVHAYLSGSGVELMGPSDNVLRGGFTPKHIDITELLATLVFEEATDPRLPALALPDVERALGKEVVNASDSASVMVYRPATTASGADVVFELWTITADATVQIPSAAIAIVTDGSFSLTIASGESTFMPRGTSFFITAATSAHVVGAGRLWIATAR